MTRDTLAAATAITLDPAATYLAISAGAGEGHPLWGWLIATVGLAPAMTVRALTVVFAAVVVWNLAVWLTA